MSCIKGPVDDFFFVRWIERISRSNRLRVSSRPTPRTKSPYPSQRYERQVFDRGDVWMVATRKCCERSRHKRVSVV